jgi:membrane-associated phospholipid phosphatase
MNSSLTSRGDSCARPRPAWASSVPPAPFGPAARWWSVVRLRSPQAALAACGTFEWLTIGYLGLLNVLIAVFHRNLPGAARYFLLHTFIAAAVPAVCWAAHRWPYASLRFLRHWYPLALFLVFFEELHYLVHLILPGWSDRWLVAFDYALFGVHPTVWLERLAGPRFNDFMAMNYMTYYLYTVILGAALYLRNEIRAFWTTMTASAAAYYIGYVIALLWPAEGPYHTLAPLQTVELTGGFFTTVMDQIESVGRVHGAAFPSAHVSGSTVALLAAWCYRRGLFWAFLPFFLGMLASTVYGRYHYAADVFGGALLGWIGFRLAGAMEARRAYRLAPASNRSFRRDSIARVSVASSSIGVNVMYPRTKAHTSVPSSSSSSGLQADQ